MVFTRLHRRWTAWVAVWAILMGALAPTVSHGVRAWSHSPISWVEVCSSNGFKLIAVAAPLQAGTPQLAAKRDAGRSLPGGEHASEHCPFCLLHAHDAALVSSPPPLILPHQAAQGALPALFLHAQRTQFAWAPPQARAPPASV